MGETIRSGWMVCSASGDPVGEFFNGQEAAEHSARCYPAGADYHARPVEVRIIVRGQPPLPWLVSGRAPTREGVSGEHPVQSGEGEPGGEVRVRRHPDCVAARCGEVECPNQRNRQPGGFVVPPTLVVVGHKHADDEGGWDDEAAGLEVRNRSGRQCKDCGAAPGAPHTKPWCEEGSPTPTGDAGHGGESGEVEHG